MRATGEIFGVSSGPQSHAPGVQICIRPPITLSKYSFAAHLSRHFLIHRGRSALPPADLAPIVYLPMEIAARDLDSRLLISLFAVKAGLEAVIGQKWLLQKNARAMPKGYWIFKTMTPGDGDQMAKMAKRGHGISAIDEEMPGLGQGGSQSLHWVDDKAMAMTETIFCNGDKHMAALNAGYPETDTHLVVTGNPRWDFLRPELRGVFEEEINALRERFGRFLLVNTNIGTYNSAKKTAEATIKGLAKDGRINLNSAEDQAYLRNLEAFETANFAAAAPLVKRLVKNFPEHQVILRPHPTEKLKPYQDALKGVSRAHVLFEGPAVKWLAATDLLVHTSCTTASEAFALGTRAICYQPIPSPINDYLLSSVLSDIATSEDEVIEQASAILAGTCDQAVMQQRQNVFNSFFAAQSGQLAAQRIANFAADAVGAKPGERLPVWKASWMFRRKWRSTKFQRQIFPDISSEEIAARISALAEVLGEPIRPNVRQCGDGQFHIFR